MSDLPYSRDGKLLTTGVIVRRGAAGLIKGRIKQTADRFVLVKWPNRTKRERYHAAALYLYQNGKHEPAPCLHDWRIKTGEAKAASRMGGWDWVCQRCGKQSWSAR